ncbi:MAG: Calcium-translocating P-type ATPase, PMCA-type [candidate division TM6 bacterium GW2011_GWF2_32_72]|nr:MAG: Calcium-translocating P-type ATPase, PMCA-type [candidate division TM6 bacterium GW2011_GWF2_32_72]
MKAWKLSVNEVLEKYNVAPAMGLSLEDANYRLKKYGPNELPEGRRSNWRRVFLKQFQSPLIYILLAAALIIFIVGPWFDAFILTIILVFNATIGTIQERRAVSILDSLKKLIISESFAIRGGEKILLEDKFLVPGDIVVLSKGERVPADIRIIESYGLKVDESVLTGESKDVNKYSEKIEKEDCSIFDQNNMIFKGTYILVGSAIGVVIATGCRTQIGQIHETIETLEVRTPIERELKRISNWILVFIALACILLFIIGLFSGITWKHLLVTLTALFICVVPEGLPVVLTLVLVSGVYRMAKKNVLVKNMQAIEALGRVDVVMIDKTGTLTRNEMIVSSVCADGKSFTVTGTGYHSDGLVLLDGKPVDFSLYPDLSLMAASSVVLNSSEMEYDKDTDTFNIKGEPTESAMCVFGEKLGFDIKKLRKDYKRIYEIPFDAQLKYHVVWFEHGDKVIALLNGSPEKTLEKCVAIKQEDLDCLENYWKTGLRVVASAVKVFDKSVFDGWETKKDLQGFFLSTIQSDWKLLGFMGMHDAIRSEVKDLILRMRKSGIHVVMATGDYLTTALFVADSVGIFQAGDDTMSGELQKLVDSKKLPEEIKNVTVFSRVTPDDKLNLVLAYKSLGNIVSMTGDGVNDAPAIVASDVGIAMGQKGSEVAKVVADLVLLDDSFLSIATAIEQGRHIFNILRKVILYFFSTNLSEVLIVLISLISGMPLPFVAPQILWLNLITDGFLDMAVAMESQPLDLLERPVRKDSRLVDLNLFLKMFYMALPMAIGSFLVFISYLNYGLPLARTMALVTLATFQWFNAWNVRSEKKSLFQIGLFSNLWLILATSVVVILQIFVLENHWLQIIFQTVSISFAQWGLVLLVASSVIWLEELRKFIVRRI